MNLTIPKRDLLSLVTRAEKCADPKGALPILGCALLVAEGDTLTLSSTTLFVGTSGTAPALVKSPGALCLPARALFERVKAMPDGPVSITSRPKRAPKGAETDPAELEDHQVTIKAAGSALQYTLVVAQARDYPPPPLPADNVGSVGLSAGVLVDLIEHVEHAIATDTARANLHAAFFEWSGELVSMVATDGRQMARLQVPSGGRAAAFSMLLPLGAVQELWRFAEGQEPWTEVLITLSEPYAYFEAGAGRFHCKLTSATFPAYQAFLTGGARFKAKVPRKALLGAVDAVGLSSSRGITLTFDAGVLLVSAESADKGEGRDEVPIEFGEKRTEIALEAVYLAAALRVLDEDDVTIEFGADLEPVIIRPVGERDYVAVVMPMRL